MTPRDGGEPIELVKDVTLVGRHEDCDLRLQQRRVSKVHCLLVKSDGFLFVRDLASTNGTKVNGQKIRRAALLPGDLLSIGGHKFRVDLGPGEPEIGPEQPTEMMPAGYQPSEPVAPAVEEESARDLSAAGRSDKEVRSAAASGEDSVGPAEGEDSDESSDVIPLADE